MPTHKNFLTMLKETTDYALSNNNTITLTSGVSANDILESITFALNVANVLQLITEFK